MFDALEHSLAVLAALAPIEVKLRSQRKSLADQVIRAAESIALNIAEGRERVGLDRIDFFRRAAGSAAELTTALRFAVARNFIGAEDFASVDRSLDRVRAMLWRLTRPKPVSS